MQHVLPATCRETGFKCNDFTLQQQQQRAWSSFVVCLSWRFGAQHKTMPASVYVCVRVCVCVCLCATALPAWFSQKHTVPCCAWMLCKWINTFWGLSQRIRPNKKGFSGLKKLSRIPDGDDFGLRKGHPSRFFVCRVQDKSHLGWLGTCPSLWESYWPYELNRQQALLSGALCVPYLQWYLQKMKRLRARTSASTQVSTRCKFVFTALCLLPSCTTLFVMMRNKRIKNTFHRRKQINCVNPLQGFLLFRALCLCLCLCRSLFSYSLLIGSLKLCFSFQHLWQLFVHGVMRSKQTFWPTPNTIKANHPFVYCSQSVARPPASLYQTLSASASGPWVLWPARHGVWHMAYGIWVLWPARHGIWHMAYMVKAKSWVGMYGVGKWVE